MALDGKWQSSFPFYVIVGIYLVTSQDPCMQEHVQVSLQTETHKLTMRRQNMPMGHTERCSLLQL